MSKTEELERIADELERVVVEGDFDALRLMYAPDATVWHNIDDKDKTVEESLAFIGGLQSVCTRTWNEQTRRTFTENGFVVQHYTCAELKTGEQLRIPSCLVITVRDGKISRVEEYIESRAAAPGFAALAAAGLAEANQ